MNFVRKSWVSFAVNGFLTIKSTRITKEKSQNPMMLYPQST